MSKSGAHEKQIRFPVRCLENATFEYFYGGAPPKIAPGTVGELIIPEASLEDAEARRLKRETVEFLPADAVILFAIDGTSASAARAECLKDASEWNHAGKPHAAEVRLKEPVTLRLRGTKPAILEAAMCWIPCLKREAESLDRAYRLVSEAFEPHQRSSSDNVLRFGYCQAHGRWRRLEELVLERQARYEMRLSQIASEVLAALPSRVADLLRLCWTGDLESSECLAGALDEYRLRMRRLCQESELIDIDTVNGLIATCEAMVASVVGRRSEEHQRLVQAAVRYLIREDDEESDTGSPSGFVDDARVVHAVAAAIERAAG